jgi:hypothetical protein
VRRRISCGPGSASAGCVPPARPARSAGGRLLDALGRREPLLDRQHGREEIALALEPLEHVARLEDEPVPAAFFSRLARFGRVAALPEVGDGFYTFERPEWFSIRGFAGDSTVEVRFKKEVMDLTEDFCYLLFSSYRDGEPESPLLLRRETAVAERVDRRLHGP